MRNKIGTQVLDDDQKAMQVELLDNRWQTLDLISVFREVQRTVSIKKTSQHQHFNGRFFWSDSRTYFDIFENLSRIPKLQKTEQVSKN